MSWIAVFRNEIVRTDGPLKIGKYPLISITRRNTDGYLEMITMRELIDSAQLTYRDDELYVDSWQVVKTRRSCDINDEVTILFNAQVKDDFKRVIDAESDNRMLKLYLGVKYLEWRNFPMTNIPNAIKFLHDVFSYIPYESDTMLIDRMRDVMDVDWLIDELDQPIARIDYSYSPPRDIVDTYRRR
jgi:hypothetical protein